MANDDVIHIYRYSERPDVPMWLRDSAKNLLDFSTGYTFEFSLGQPDVVATFFKTTGITGAAGSGVGPTGVPNLTLTFTAGERDNLTPGTTTWQVNARTGGKDRFWQGVAVVHGIILPPP